MSFFQLILSPSHSPNCHPGRHVWKIALLLITVILYLDPATQAATLVPTSLDREIVATVVSYGSTNSAYSADGIWNDSVTQLGNKVSVTTAQDTAINELINGHIIATGSSSAVATRSSNAGPGETVTGTRSFFGFQFEAGAEDSLSLTGDYSITNFTNAASNTQIIYSLVDTTTNTVIFTQTLQTPGTNLGFADVYDFTGSIHTYEFTIEIILAGSIKNTNKSPLSAAYNNLALEIIPEPSTAILLLLGGLLFATSRRPSVR